MNLSPFTQVPLELQRTLIAGKVLWQSEFFTLVSNLTPTWEGSKLVSAVISGQKSNETTLILLFVCV